MTRPTHRRPLATSTGVAHRLAEAVRPFIGGDLPVRLQAWDGSVAGPEDAPLVVLRSPDALRRLLWHPGELGAAQAYVTGELDVPEQDGWDLSSALTHAFAVGAERGLSGVRRSPRAVIDALRTAAGLGALGRPPAPPASQAQIKGRLHSLARDRSAISHHYDLSNEFYSLILEPQMAYSCGYHATPDTPLEEAQRAKLDLVCTKLGLEPGMRMLDVGCGWGSLSLHAAEHFGAQVTGVTIAAEQKKFIDARIAERGLSDRVEIRLQDYREVPERDHFDAVGSLEMGEHVGAANYPTYVEVLRRAVRPGGRVLIQQMSRQGAGGGKHPGGGPFIESFIAPDMTMRPVGETVGLIEAGGLEVRDVHALREHYVLTVAGWIERFEANLPRLTELVGEEVVRVWRLYLVGGALAFRDGRMGVDQILAVRPGCRSHDPGGPLMVTAGLLALAAISVMTLVTILASRKAGRVSVVDVAWGLVFVASALAIARVGRHLAQLAAGRTRHHLGRPSRLAHLRPLPRARRGPALCRDARRAGGFGAGASRKVFLTQAVAAWLVSLPLDRRPARTTSAGRGWSGSAWRCGWSAWCSSRSATPSWRRTKAPEGSEAAGHGHRPVGLDPAPQLLRRRLRVVGPLAGRRCRDRLAGRAC